MRPERSDGAADECDLWLDRREDGAALHRACQSRKDGGRCDAFNEQGANIYCRTRKGSATLGAKRQMKTAANFFGGGGGRTRTYEGVSQRIYSPPPLPLGTLPHFGKSVT